MYKGTERITEGYPRGDVIGLNVRAFPSEWLHEKIFDDGRRRNIDLTLEAPNKHINLEKLWRNKKLDLDLTELWLNYLLHFSCYCGRKIAF